MESNDLDSGREFTQLYADYHKAIYSVISQYIWDRQLAEDVLQLTFLKISKHLSRFDKSKGALYSWMRRIAVNTALDVLKSVSFKTRKLCISLDDPGINNKYFSDGELKTDCLGVKGLLAVLTTNERVVIDLLYYRGFTQSETAAYLQIPLGTVKSRVRYAILKLRRAHVYECALM
jgi:RNA polymerase sigma factor (sigma-70 family)